jgi:hypothetical protein
MAASKGSATKPPTTAARLVRLAHNRYAIVKDDSGQTYAVPKTPPRIAVPLHGRGALTKRLTLDYFTEHRTTPNATALTSAMSVLEAEADGSERVSVHLRTARFGDGLVIDLGEPDGRAVVVGDGRWKVVAGPPPEIIFRRTRLIGAMPRPARTRHGLAQLRDLLNVEDAGWDLIRAWLVLALLPDVPVPILTVTGQQGAGKSVLARTLVSVVDPSPAPLRSAPRGRDLAEWQTVASGSRVVALDNISRINEEFSDALCRAVTGDGGAKRELYTDTDLVVHSFRRALILTSIDPGALRGDLGERLMPVELSPLGGRRRGEREMDAELERRRPTILGGLLDLVADVLANPVTMEKPPRMADAAHVMAAVDKATGSSAVEAYTRGQARIVETVLEGDPLASAVVAFMEARDDGEWTGTPTELYAALVLYATERNWPSNARAMTERLNRLAPSLLFAHRLDYGPLPRGDRRGVRLRRKAERPPGRRTVKPRVKWSGHRA